jgi:hypothetical protein
MRFSSFIREIRPADAVFFVHFPDKDRGLGLHFGPFSRSEAFTKDTRPKFDVPSVQWCCQLADFERINAFLVSISYFDCVPDDSEALITAAAAEQAHCRHLEEMGREPRLAWEKTLYRRHPDKWKEIRRPALLKTPRSRHIATSHRHHYDAIQNSPGHCCRLRRGAPRAPTTWPCSHSETKRSVANV